MPGLEGLVDVSQYTPDQAAKELMKKAAEKQIPTKLEDVGLAQFQDLFEITRETYPAEDVPGRQLQGDVECLVISFQGQQIGYIPAWNEEYFNRVQDGRLIETQEQYNRNLVLCMYQLTKAAAQRADDEAGVQLAVRTELNEVVADAEMQQIMKYKRVDVRTPREIQDEAGRTRRQTNRSDTRNERAENVLHQNTRLLLENLETTLIGMGSVQIEQLRLQLRKLDDEMQDYLRKVSEPGVNPFDPQYALELTKIKARLKYTLAGVIVEAKEHEVEKRWKHNRDMKFPSEIYELAKTAGFDTRNTNKDTFLWKVLKFTPIVGMVVRPLTREKFGYDIRQEMDKYIGMRSALNYDPVTGGYVVDNQAARKFDRGTPRANGSAREVAQHMGGTGIRNVNGEVDIDRTGEPYVIADDMEAYDSNTANIIKRYGLETPGIRVEYVDADGDGDTEPKIYYNLNQIPDRLLVELYLQADAESTRGGAMGNGVEKRKHEIAILKRFVKNPGEKARRYEMLAGDGATTDVPGSTGTSPADRGRDRMFDIFKSTIFDEATQKEFRVEYRTSYNRREMSLPVNYFNFPSEKLKSREAIMINTFIKTFFSKYPLLASQSTDAADMTSANPMAMGALLQVFSPAEMVAMIERNCTSVDLNKDPGVGDAYATKGVTGEGGVLDQLKYRAYQQNPSLGKIVGFFTDGTKFVGRAAETVAWVGAGFNLLKTAWKGAGAMWNRITGKGGDWKGVGDQALLTAKWAGGAVVLDQFVNDPNKSALPMEMLKDAAGSLGRNDKWKAESDARAVNTSPWTEVHDDKVDPEVQLKQSIGTMSLQQLTTEGILTFNGSGDPKVDGRVAADRNPTYFMKALERQNGSATMYENMGRDFSQRLFDKGFSKDMVDRILAHPVLATTPLSVLLERYDQRIDTVKNIENVVKESSGIRSKEEKLMFHFLPEVEYKEKIQILAFAGQQLEKMTNTAVLAAYIGANDGAQPESKFVVPAAKYKLILQRLAEVTDASGKPAGVYLKELLKAYVEAPDFATRVTILNSYFKVLKTVYSDPDETLESGVTTELDGNGDPIDEDVLRWDYGLTHPTLFNRSLAGYFHSTDQKYGGGIIPNLTVGAWGVRTGVAGYDPTEITHIDHAELEAYTTTSRADIRANATGWEEIGPKM